MGDKIFYDGVCIATCRDKHGNTFYGLEDEAGNELCPKEYTFIHRPEFGHFLAEKGVRKNLLRPNGSLVLNEWFHDIYSLNADGCFIYGNTIRKTKTTPTQYPRGIAHVSGIYLFPMVYSMVRRMTKRQTEEDIKAGKDPEYTRNFYAEKDGAPYILCSDGGLFDPKNSHLPQKVSLDHKDLIEKVMNWVLPGLQFYYRDTNAPVIVKDTYHVGDILRAGTFIDATTKLLKPAHKTRFIIASAHGARLAEQEGIFDDAKKWGLTLFHYNSYFKVMDVYELDGVTQVLLLHIPAAAAFFMGDGETLLNFVNDATGGETSIVDMARRSLQEKMKQEVHPRSLDKEFVERMEQPVGLNEDYWPIPFNMEGEPADEKAAQFSAFIHHLAEDDNIDGFLREEDNFEFTGAEGSVCENCIYKRGIVGNGEGCGRLFKASFRDRWLRGRCEYKKTSLGDPSLVEYRKQQDILQAKKQSDEFALKLVKDFIAEELDGDIEKFATFDFENVKNPAKYGSTHYSVQASRNKLMLAVMSLLFAEYWPELNVDALEHYNYQCGYIMSQERLFDLCMSNPLCTTPRWREVSPEMRERGQRVTKLARTIGNWWLLSKGTKWYNTEQNSKFRGYGDQYLIDLYKTMTSTAKCKVGRKVMMLCESEVLKGHVGEQGFNNFIKEEMLEDFVDYNGKPYERVDMVWLSKKDMTDEQYQKALVRFCDFCEEFIPKRTKRMIERLKTIID